MKGYTNTLGSILYCSMKKLAIGITTFNNCENIDNIEKIYNLENIDVYIVDDYSTDGTQELLQQKNIKYDLTPQKIGAPGFARNMIIEMAIQSQNEFISFIDGDDDVILENLDYIAGQLDSKYDMYYTPMLVVGYNGARIPLGVSNYSFSGPMFKEKLLATYMFQRRFELLLGSGGRIYNLNVINKYNLKYDRDKSGQDGLFNHDFFDKTSSIYFNDVTKPFYVYDIQLNTLSNNYNYEILKGRLELIGKAAEYEFTINSKIQYADKAYNRYTNTNLIAEPQKLEIVKLLSEFSGKDYNYRIKNDYLKPVEINYNYELGINIILVNCNIDVPEHKLFNVVHIKKLENYDQVVSLLKYSKTIFIDETILSINFEFLLEMVKSQEQIIQPSYLLNNQESALSLELPVYHGYSTTGMYMTYTFVGMVFDSKLLVQYDFSFVSYFEYLVKALFLSREIPKIYNTSGFYKIERNKTKFYNNAIVDTFIRTYSANTRGKIATYSKLATNDIVPGSFIGKKPSYQSKNMSYEEHSFIETEMLEFENFDGAYIINEDNQITEIISNKPSFNFTNAICARVVKNSKYNDEKELINIPAKYDVDGFVNIKTKQFTILVSQEDINSSKVSSVSILEFKCDVEKTGENNQYINLVSVDGQAKAITTNIIPKGRYKLVISNTDRNTINDLNQVEFKMVTK